MKLREHEHHVEEVKRGLPSPTPPKKVTCEPPAGASC